MPDAFALVIPDLFFLACRQARDWLSAEPPAAATEVRYVNPCGGQGSGACAGQGTQCAQDQCQRPWG